MSGMRNIKTSLLKIRYNIHISLISDANVPVHFRAQQRAKYSSLQLKANCIVAQTDLRITEHRGHKFSPSLLLLSVQNSNRMASRLTTIASFPSVFLQLLQYSRQHPSFLAHWAALMTKTDLNYPGISLGFLDFAVQFCFHCKMLAKLNATAVIITTATLS